MLYPNFKELLLLEKSVNLIKKGFHRSSVNELSGNYLSRFKGQGMEFNEVREYAYGDDVRNIDWRVSARTDSTHIKTFQEERQRNVLIMVDNNDYMRFGTRGTFKNIQAAKVASLIGFAANKNMDRVGCYIFGNSENRYEYFRPKNSKNSFLKGLKSLCEAKEVREGYSLEGALFNLRRLNANPNILFIISSFREDIEDIEKHLFFLKRRGEIVLINIIDDSDSMIPDIGRVVLKYGDKRFLLNTSNKKGMDSYHKDYIESQQKLTKLAAKVRGKIININTKDDPIKALARGLKL